MPQPFHVLLCAAFAMTLWVVVGAPLARRLVSDRALALALAPALGWAVLNAAAVPVLLVLPFAQPVLLAMASAALIVGLAFVWRGRMDPHPVGAMPALPWWAVVLAALLAVAPALAITPKFVGDGVLLAEQMYDHSKIAMIDDLARFGLPPGNPFFGEAGAPSRLAYYYLWHFGAAFFAKSLTINGWEADIALTWATAFASLAAMMGLAVSFSGRRSAAFWVVLLSASLSLRPILSDVFGAGAVQQMLSSYPSLQGWLLQAGWVPQHLAAATSVVLALVLIARLGESRSRLLCPTIALVVAAGFESSTWIGGIAFAAASVPVGIVLLRSLEPARRWGFVAKAALSAGLAVALAFPFLRDEYVATAARGIGVPIAFWPYEVLGPIVPDGIRRLLDLPAYWLVLLIVEFPAIYLAGTVTLMRASFGSDRSFAGRRLAEGFAALALMSFGVAWLFASTIANNDLGWRAALPGTLVLTVFAAVGIARWVAAPAPIAAAASLILVALGLPDGWRQMRDYATGVPAATAASFAASPDLWAAVRRYAGPDERVGDNPLYLDQTVVWPVNISWALFAGRRSCFAGRDLANAYVALPAAEIDRLAKMFERVFAGDGSPDEIRDLALRYECRVIAITPGDGAWRHDDFADSPAYRLVEENPNRWRLYRAVNAPTTPP
jgi:hypothetical protein